MLLLLVARIAMSPSWVSGISLKWLSEFCRCSVRRLGRRLAIVGTAFGHWIALCAWQRPSCRLRSGSLPSALRLPSRERRVVKVARVVMAWSANSWWHPNRGLVEGLSTGIGRIHTSCCERLRAYEWIGRLCRVASARLCVEARTHVFVYTTSVYVRTLAARGRGRSRGAALCRQACQARQFRAQPLCACVPPDAEQACIGGFGAEALAPEQCALMPLPWPVWPGMCCTCGRYQLGLFLPATLQ